MIFKFKQGQKVMLIKSNKISVIQDIHDNKNGTFRYGLKGDSVWREPEELELIPIKCPEYFYE